MGRQISGLDGIRCWTSRVISGSRKNRDKRTDVGVTRRDDEFGRNMGCNYQAQINAGYFQARLMFIRDAFD